MLLSTNPLRAGLIQTVWVNLKADGPHSFAAICFGMVCCGLTNAPIRSWGHWVAPAFQTSDALVDGHHGGAWVPKM